MLRVGAVPSLRSNWPTSRSTTSGWLAQPPSAMASASRYRLCICCFTGEKTERPTGDDHLRQDRTGALLAATACLNRAEDSQAGRAASPARRFGASGSTGGAGAWPNVNPAVQGAVFGNPGANTVPMRHTKNWPGGPRRLRWPPVGQEMARYRSRSTAPSKMPARPQPTRSGRKPEALRRMRREDSRGAPSGGAGCTPVHRAAARSGRCQVQRLQPSR